MNGEIDNKEEKTNESEVKDAEIVEGTDEKTKDETLGESYTEKKEKSAKKKKSDFYIELALFLILGILIGIALKTEAVKRITIGHDDYLMKIKNQDYNINKIETDLAEKNASASSAAGNEELAPEENAPVQEGDQTQDGAVTPPSESENPVTGEGTAPTPNQGQ